MSLYLYHIVVFVLRCIVYFMSKTQPYIRISIWLQERFHEIWISSNMVFGICFKTSHVFIYRTNQTPPFDTVIYLFFFLVAHSSSYATPPHTHTLFLLSLSCFYFFSSCTLPSCWLSGSTWPADGGRAYTLAPWRLEEVHHHCARFWYPNNSATSPTDTPSRTLTRWDMTTKS